MSLRIKFFIASFLLILTCSSLSAQLCSGSLGDPIVNITFGAGSNPGPPLQAATTAYQYVSDDCPRDGYYAVRNNTTACFGNTWLNLSADHTGDPNGYFMLVNASFAPSVFYLDTIRGLCGNTTYEFAAWIMNVIRAPSICGVNEILPNLTFSIEKTDGTILQSYNTNDIPSHSSPVWQQFGFNFTTPGSVSDIVLKMYNNANGGCGNDLALDDITFRACGPKLTPSISGIPSDSVSLCQGTAKAFTFTCAVSPGFSNPTYQWQKSINNGLWTDIPGANATTLFQSFLGSGAAGIYSYRLTAAEAGNASSLQCRVVSKPLIVQVNANPVTTIANNGPACQNGALVLSASGGNQYAWSGVNSFTASGPSVIITPVKLSSAGKYYVQVTDGNGCTHYDSTLVKVNAAPVANTNFSAATICTGHSIGLIASGGGTYTWLPATGLSSADVANPIASPLINTNYIVTVTNQFSCTDTASILIDVNETPTANAGPDKTIIAGNPIKLMGSSTGQSVTYLWSPAIYIDDAGLLQPTVNPPADIDYVLSAISANGCGTATDTMHLFVFKAVYIPLAFSPNGDGLNDTWKIPALNAFPSFELSVFNRYGQVVFKNKNNNVPWDGTFKGEPASAGAYIYFIDLKHFPGVLKGTVMLIR